MTSSSDALDLSGCKVALVLNSSAGKKDALARQDMIRERLAPNVGEFAPYAVHEGKGLANAAKRAAEEGAQVVVALGGDGTQAAVAGALIGTDAVMGVLPGGTFNYFSRDLGVGETLEAALDTLLTAHVRAIDIGNINGRIFLNNASFGVYPEILEHREAVYRRWGRTRVAAYWSVLLALRDLRDPMHLVLTKDGVTQDFRTALAFAARSAVQLDSMGLEGAEAVRNGQFALFLAKGHRPRDLIAAAFRLAFGNVARGKDFELIVTDDILIEARHARRMLALDGEKQRIVGPYRLKVQRGALSVIAPAPAEVSESDLPEAG